MWSVMLLISTHDHAGQLPAHIHHSMTSTAPACITALISLQQAQNDMHDCDSSKTLLKIQDTMSGARRKDMAE
jgi:hypothetical protein